jgi:hypothetical protein
LVAASAPERARWPIKYAYRKTPAGTVEEARRTGGDFRVCHQNLGQTGRIKPLVIVADLFPNSF